jgi:type VI secretion system protein ImpM
VATFSHAGLYGKIPAQPDFVRLRAADGPARPLVLWLEEGSEAAKRAGAPCGSEPVRFLFRPAGAARALAGVLVGSGDKVGRSFPLALFAQVESPDLAASFPALPLAAAGFLDAAAALAREAAGLSAGELSARLESLPLPGAHDLAAGAAEARSRAALESARDLLARLFGEAGNGQRLYALHCFRTACQGVRGKEPARAAAVLDCPVRSEVDRWAWLELARRGLGWQAPPSFFWSAPRAAASGEESPSDASSGTSAASTTGGGELEVPGSRLLISLGPPPASAFGALWRPGANDGRIWPLVTDKPAAIAAAERALGESVIGALDRHSLTVADLFNLVMP